MKSTGIVRRIDNFGRVVIPKELRKTLMLNEGELLEIYTDDDTVVLRKYGKNCTKCGESDTQKLIEKEGFIICDSCLKELNGGNKNV